MNANDVDMSKVNRLEVIDEDGRSYVNWQDHALGIEMSLQDGGRTIKVFTKGQSNVAAKENAESSPHERAVTAAFQGCIEDAFQDCIGVGGVPSNAEFFAEFTQRLAGRLGIPAAAKEEQSKVLTDEEIERLADECFGNMLNGIKHRPLADLEQKAAMSTISMYRTALRYARDNGYLAPAPASGWISVDDRLPEPKTLVLTWSWKQGFSVEWMVNDAGWDLDPPPTYWMPFPPLPDK